MSTVPVFLMYRYGHWNSSELVLVSTRWRPTQVCTTDNYGKLLRFFLQTRLNSDPDQKHCTSIHRQWAFHNFPELKKIVLPTAQLWSLGVFPSKTVLVFLRRKLNIRQHPSPENIKVLQIRIQDPVLFNPLDLGSESGINFVRIRHIYLGTRTVFLSLASESWLCHLWWTGHYGTKTCISKRKQQAKR
jgi:hypothetical protein